MLKGISQLIRSKALEVKYTDQQRHFLSKSGLQHVPLLSPDPPGLHLDPGPYRHHWRVSRISCLQQPCSKMRFHLHGQSQAGSSFAQDLKHVICWWWESYNFVFQAHQRCPVALFLFLTNINTFKIKWCLLIFICNINWNYSIW